MSGTGSPRTEHPPLAELWLLRHGESVANVAATAADRSGAEEIDIDVSDAEVALSTDGEQQARALGSWLGGQSLEAGSTRVVSSSYHRAEQTIRIALAEAGLDLPVRVDERLRDRELGILDRLTPVGVAARFPFEAERRRRLGKFAHRPPGGESWADVALRLRSILAELEHPGPKQLGPEHIGPEHTAGDPGRSAPPSRVIIAAHDAVVVLVLYVLLGWTVAELMEFARTNTVANASVTRLTRPPGGEWRLAEFSGVAHLEAADAPLTEHSGERDVRPR